MEMDENSEKRLSIDEAHPTHTHTHSLYTLRHTEGVVANKAEKDGGGINYRLIQRFRLLRIPV